MLTPAGKPASRALRHFTSHLRSDTNVDQTRKHDLNSEYLICRSLITMHVFVVQIDTWWRLPEGQVMNRLPRHCGAGAWLASVHLHRCYATNYICICILHCILCRSRMRVVHSARHALLQYIWTVHFCNVMFWCSFNVSYLPKICICNWYVHNIFLFLVTKNHDTSC